MIGVYADADPMPDRHGVIGIDDVVDGVGAFGDEAPQQFLVGADGVFVAELFELLGKAVVNDVGVQLVEVGRNVIEFALQDTDEALVVGHGNVFDNRRARIVDAQITG